MLPQLTEVSNGAGTLFKMTVTLTNSCSFICYVRLNDTRCLAPKLGVGEGVVEAGNFDGDGPSLGKEKKEKKRLAMTTNHGQTLIEARPQASV